MDPSSCRNWGGNCSLTSTTWLKPLSQIVYAQSPSRIICFLPCKAFGIWCSSQAMHSLSLPTRSVSDAQHGIPVRCLFRVVLESSEDFLNYRNLPGPSCNEDASLSAVSRIHLGASLKLFVLFYSVSRQPFLGTVKYALAHFFWTRVYISAWKSPLCLLRIYLMKVGISQVPCKVIMVDLTSGIMHIVKS